MSDNIETRTVYGVSRRLKGSDDPWRPYDYLTDAACVVSETMARSGIDITAESHKMLFVTHEADGVGRSVQATVNAKFCGLLVQALKQWLPENTYRVDRITVTDHWLIERIDGICSWEAREHQRFKDGTYTPVPQEFMAIPWVSEVNQARALYIHRSTRKPHLIAYTPDRESGIRDRQIAQSIGRFIEAFLPNSQFDTLRAREIAIEQAISIWRTHCGGTPEQMVITSDPDQIEHVYTNGPNSCMSHDASDYESYCHPVRVYGAPGDLALAYVTETDGSERDDDDLHERIIARALVWPERKVYGRIYGNLILKHKLQIAGYIQGNFIGARIRKMWDSNNDCYVLPYLDGEQWLLEHGDNFFIIDPDGTHHAGRTDGLSEEPNVSCERCGDHTREEDLYTIADIDETWCSDCAHNHALMDEGEFVSTENYTIVDAGSYEGDVIRRDDSFCCEHTGMTYHLDDLVIAPDGEAVAEENLADYCDKYSLETDQDEEAITSAA